MESQEDGCHHRSECVNYGDKCEVCSAHYTNEFSDTIEEEEDVV